MKKKIAVLVMSLIVGVLSGTVFAGEIPRGYPFSFWGEARTGEERSMVTGRFEQGVDVTGFGEWALVPFVALGASTGSERSEYWNNGLVPEVGVKVTHPLRLSEGGWGGISIGVRQRWEEYFESFAEDRADTEVFLQFGFGGDWKK